jgi:enoyl-CoA hydratase
MAAKSLVAIGLCKEAVGNGLDMSLDKGCAYEADLFARSFSTGDQQEGMAAFLAKRPPLFRDC